MMTRARVPAGARLLGAFVAVWAMGGTEASAATITLEHSSSVCTFTPESTTNVATGTFNSTSCAEPLAGGGSYSAVHTTRGVFDAGGLELGAALTLDVSSTTSTVLAAESTALFEDTITLLGGTSGTLGFLELTFDITGSALEDGSGSALGSMRFFFEGFLVGNQTITGATTITATVPFLFGTAGELGISLTASASAALSPTSGTSFTADVDFLNTATLLGVQVLDENKNVLPGGRVESSSNLTYPSLSASAPEPATLALLGAGLATFAVRRRRSARS